MIKRTFLDKSNTIFEGCNENFGLHPISMLNYGLEKSRVLLHFNIEEIKEFIDKCPSGAAITHTLKMTNCGSVDIKHFDKKIPSYDIHGMKSRATSFTIYAFPITNRVDEEGIDKYIEWDEGVGFDSNADFWISGTSSVSDEGSNWFNRKSGFKWLKNGCIGDSDEIDKSDIIASQHFDHGNENLELDLTDYINNILGDTLNEWSSHNDGICLSIEPKLDGESIGEYDYSIEGTKYVGFFNEKTNTFFMPYVESRCEEYICDNRYNFTIGQTNKLYLYIHNENGFIDLDEKDISCKINDDVFSVKRFSEGIFYIEVDSNNNFEGDMIYEDVWITPFGEFTQEFVAHPSLSFFSITPDAPREEICEPSLSGINDDEQLNSGEVRKIDVKFRIPYSTKYKTLNKTEYRLYTKDSNKQIDVISWDKIHNAGKINFFLLNTSELVPGTYYIDIRIKTLYQTRIFENVLHFNKVSNITRIKR
jgi:hypothetical protein